MIVNKITFLDVEVEISQDGMLLSNLYMKPAVDSTTLRANSNCHGNLKSKEAADKLHSCLLEW